MSTESLTNSASHASSSSTSHTKPREHSQLSDSIQNDLATTSQLSTTPAAKTNNHQQTAAPAGATLASQQQSSPTKSSPTKSRNKRRNDARKRSATIKKQQLSTPATDPSSQQQRDTKKDSIVTRAPSEQPNEISMTAAGKQDHELFPNSSGRSQEQAPSSASAEGQKGKSTDMKKTDEGSMSLNSNNHGEQPVSDKSPTSLKGDQLGPMTENANSNNRTAHDMNSWHRRQRENRELREQIKFRETQLQTLAERVKQQMGKIKELEASLVSTTRTCIQFEKLLQQELTNRSRLEAENDNLNAAVVRLKNQVSSHEKDKSANNELIRVLNATLMERETEVSILKLKMTRLQTNPSIGQNNLSSNLSLTKPDPCKTYTMAGRSNSEFTRNSYTRSTMMAEAINTRSSTSQLQSDDRDASVWATVPEELTPSKRPVLLERNLPTIYDQHHSIYHENQSSTPLIRDRRYKTLPKSMKNPPQLDKPNETKECSEMKNESTRQLTHCLVTNLDESNNSSRSSGNRSSEAQSKIDLESKPVKQYSVDEIRTFPESSSKNQTISTNEESSHSNVNNSISHYSTIGNTKSTTEIQSEGGLNPMIRPPTLPARSPSTPVKTSFGLKRIFEKFKRSDSTADSKSKTDLTLSDPPATPIAGPFQRGSTRSTLIGTPSSFTAHMSPRKAIDFRTDKPFAEWDTNMLVDWLTMIGLSMYANQCRRWVECGAHIMNATPAEVDKGLGITNHLHRKKLRLAISELNGDCDKITKAAARLDYLWVARWLDDIGLPQYKEAFINARVDGRVLNYLTIEDLVSLGVRSLLHHSSIRCGIKVLRSINFDLQLLKRRATAEEIERMSSVRQSIEEQANNCSNANTSNVQQVGAGCEAEVRLWTCHRVMEWLRMIDFAEFAPNLRGSGVHGGLITHEDAFNIDTMSTLLSIPSSRTLLRRHLSTFFQNLIGEELVHRKRQHKDQSSSQRLNPSAEIKASKKSPLWFGKLKSSKVGQDGMDEYLCPMYPVEPQIVKSPVKKMDPSRRDGSNLPRIPESVNV